MRTDTFPILEFDASRDALIRPEAMQTPTDIAQHCVLCFFAEALDALLQTHPYRVAGHFRMEGSQLPVCELTWKDRRVALIQAAVGAPLAAAQLEELTALGCRKFVVCGSCGVLDSTLPVGHVILPTSAVRDEGTSYHYLPPAREIAADNRAVSALEQTLQARGVPYIKAKTWTTDALYRETREKIARRKAEGCMTVDMEASAYMAVAQYNGVTLGQLLYAGDNLDTDTWDSRAFYEQTSARSILLELALDACLAL